MGLYGWDEKTKFEFLDKYYKNVLEECTMLPNANTTIKKLKNEGDTIHFVTAYREISLTINVNREKIH